MTTPCLDGLLQCICIIQLAEAAPRLLSDGIAEQLLSQDWSV